MNKYYILSIHDIYEDNYENGEGIYCNGWTQQKIVKAKNLDQALNIYFSNEIYLDYKKIDFEIDFNKIYISELCNEKNFWASVTEIEKWQKGEIKLYIQHVVIKVEIMQEVNIEEEITAF